MHVYREIENERELLAKILAVASRKEPLGFADLLPQTTRTRKPRGRRIHIRPVREEALRELKDIYPFQKKSLYREKPRHKKPPTPWAKPSNVSTSVSPPLCECT